MPYKQNLPRFLNGHFARETFVVHQELDQVKQLPWLQVVFVADTALVHRLILRLGDFSIKVVVHFPNGDNVSIHLPLLDLAHLLHIARDLFRFDRRVETVLQMLFMGGF